MLCKQTILIISLLTLSACQSLPSREDVAPEPIRITIPEVTNEQWNAGNLLGVPTPPTAWAQDLNSPELISLIEQADAKNYTLKAAYERWQAAQAQTTITNSSRRPEISADADAVRTRSNSQTFDTLSARVRLNWELDVWQRLSDQTRAAVNDEQAFAIDYRAAQLSLAAQVAQTWYNLLEADQQAQLATETARTFQQSLDVIEERYRRGLNSALDVRLARSDLASAKNEIARREREKDGFTRQIEVLLGRYPSADRDGSEKLPESLVPVPVGLPADLLSRRPDILSAEARLNAAGDRLQFARKNRLPSIRLSGNGGVSSDSLAQLLDWDSLVFSLLAGIVQPIYQGGKLDAQRMLASAQHKEAWANYVQIVLIAFQEVETALAAESRFTQQLEELLSASEEAEAAAELALTRYQNGLTDIITLLQSQRQTFSSRSQYLNILRQRINNRVGLYLALGGGFVSEASGNDVSIELQNSVLDKE